jgi:hypothetical protein
MAEGDPPALVVESSDDCVTETSGTTDDDRSFVRHVVPFMV